MTSNAARASESELSRADEPVLEASLSSMSPDLGAFSPAPTVRRPLDRLHADARRFRRALAAATCFMAAWSMFEVPWEIDISSSREQTAAVIAAKSLLLVIVACSLRGRRWARYLLLFVCLTSVLAIAPELPAEFERSSWLAILSSVECVAKLAVLVLLALYLKVASRASVFR